MIRLFAVGTILLLLAPVGSQGAQASTQPLDGSDESKIAIGDTPAKVVALLGGPESFFNLTPTRSQCVFKRCTIIFESQKVAELPVMKTQADLARESASRKRAAVDRLVSLFDAEHTNDGSAIYIHKAFPKGKYGTMPAVIVDGNGTLGLVTSYFGGAWIFHDSAIVKVGEKGMPTSILPRGTIMRRMAGQGGFIEERCVFSSRSDQEIIRMIANAGNGVFIMLCNGHTSVASRLTEQQFVSFPPIAELSGAELSAVRDSVALSDAISSSILSRDDSAAGANTNKIEK